MTQATTSEAKSPSQSVSRQLKLVDCDVHAGINRLDDLMPYLPDVWQRYVRATGFSGPTTSGYPTVKPGGNRDDAWPPSGRAPGSDLAFLQKQHMDQWGVDRAILTPIYRADHLPNVDLGAALCSAYNDYMIEHWYEKDERLYGSITIPFNDATLAVREIERLGDHPKVVQIILGSVASDLYGKRRFHPIWEAAEKHDLALAIHFGGAGSGTASGAPSYYLERHTNMSQAFMAHTVSMVCEGVFVRFPNLRVVLIEGGSAWLPSLMWRLDKNWRSCRMEVPWLKRRPSDYIREHFRLTTQPIEEPDNPEHLLQVIDHMGSDQMLMFASDYPHWDFDSPASALPRRISQELRERIFSLNASELYGLT